jgi:hypothetical protein
MMYIGIDPAARRLGCALCVIRPAEGLAEFHRFDNALELVEFIAGVKDAVFCVEDSSLINATYRGAASAAVQNRMSRNAGANQGISKLICEYLGKRYGTNNVLRLSPKGKGAPVLDPEIFAQLLTAEGYTTINHVRKIVDDDRVAYHLAQRAHLHHKITKQIVK